MHVCHTHAHSFISFKEKKRISYREMSFFIIIQMYVLYFKLFADQFFFLLSGDRNQGNWELKCFVVFYLSSYF